MFFLLTLMWILKIFVKHIKYTDNQKAVEQEEDIKAIQRGIRCCYKENSFAIKLLNYLLSEITLFTLHNCWTSCSLD